MGHYIYKVTDLTNGKLYIGQTSQPHERRLQHEACHPNEDCLFHRALKAHGKENFKWEILFEVPTKKMADDFEIIMIQAYGSRHPNGYNMAIGGQGGSMWNARPVVCLEKDGTYVGRYESAAEAQRLGGYCNSDVLISCKDRTRLCRGKRFMFEDEYNENGPGEPYKAPKSALRKAIVQCDSNGNAVARYESVSDASKITGFERAGISSALIGQRKFTHGYIFVYEKDYPIKDMSKYKVRKKGIPVAQIDPKTGKEIARYDRIADAGRAIGRSYKTIHKVLDSETWTAYGYIWKSIS